MGGLPAYATTTDAVWPAPAGVPIIAGTPEVGLTLTCTGPGDTFQWLRDGTPITGATIREYVVQALDVGQELSCLATSSADAVSVPGEPSEPENFTPHVLLPQGGHTWFVLPHGIYVQGTRRQAVVGGVSGATGDIQAAALDLDTGQRVAFTLRAALQKDDHDNPSFLEHPDGTVSAFYCKHSDASELAIRHRRTVNPENFTAWTSEAAISVATGGSNTRLAYPKPFRLSAEDDRLYLMYRSPSGVQRIRWSDNDGVSWGAEHELLTGGGTARPYVHAVSNGSDRIDFICTEDHPRILNASIYHGYIQNGDVHLSDGTVLQAVTAGAIDVTTLTKVYDYVTGGSDGWMWSLIIDADGHPRFGFANFPTPTDHRYRYARWTGSEWTHAEICDAGADIHTGVLNPDGEPQYSGGVAIDPQNPSHVYVSRQKSTQVWEIERWTTDDDGLTWEFDVAITESDDRKNVRPYVIRGVPADGPRLIWMRGNDGAAQGGYTTYETWNTATVEFGKEIV